MIFEIKILSCELDVGLTMLNAQSTFPYVFVGASPQLPPIIALSSEIL